MVLEIKHGSYTNIFMIKENNMKEIPSRLETLVEIGLGKKGYTFSDKDDMYLFLNKSCSVERDGFMEKFFIGEHPFLLIDNTPYFNFDSINRASVVYGDFKFL